MKRYLLGLFIRICDAFLSGLRLYRRLRGGHWEHWYLPDGAGPVWIQREHGERLR